MAGRHSVKSRFLGSTEGVSALEFAIIAPVAVLPTLALLGKAKAMKNVGDLDAVLAIYNQVILTSDALWRDEPVDLADVAGPAILKRLAPVVALAAIVALLLRRRK